MSMPLTSVEDVLSPILAQLAPVRPRRVATADALGYRLAAPVLAGHGLPLHAIALRSGVAVRSLDLVGASSHTPVLLARPPKRVQAGDRLPDGCDAVIDPDAMTFHGVFAEVTDSVVPGSHVRLPGHDVAACTVLAPAGTVITPELALACTEAGIVDVDVATIGVHAGFANDPLRTWLKHRLAGLQCVSASAGDADLILRAASADAPPRTALQPGETGWITREGGQIIVDCPARFDGCIAVLLALVLPVIAKLTGADTARQDVTLTRKLSSNIGSTELALFLVNGDIAEPLGVADITLAHFARATAFALIPPDVEGHGAGSRLHVTPFGTMYIGQDP